jgi:hypothetical protein
MCKKLIYLISVLVLALCLMSSAQAANITLVTEDHDFDEDGIQDDQQLVDWLVAEGHVVDVQRDYWTSFGRTTAAELNAADLIIVSRSTSSGNYDDEDEPTKWNSLTVPLILMSAYPVRSSHWKWVDSASVLGEGGAPMLEAVDPGHSIFTNVPLDASNQVQIVDPAVGSGHTSFIDVADVGNGTLIAQTVDGLPWIVEWDAGVEFYAGAGEVPAGTRMMFLAGTQEPPTWGQWNLTAEGEILFRNAISYMLGEPIAVIEPPPPALVAHWKLDDGEGTIAVDSANGLDGILMGDPQWADGKIDGALDFDGDGDYVDCGTNETLNSLNEAITASAWINIRSITTAWMAVMAKGENAWRISVNGETTGMHFGFSGGDRGWQAANSASELPFNEWHHVAATYNLQNGGLIYLDGVVDGNNPDLGGVQMNEMPFLIGENPEATGRFFDGLIDDVRIYDGAMTAEQIQAVMTPKLEPVDPGTEGLVAYFPLDNDVLDASGNGNDGTIDGDPTFVEGVVGMAMEFDGDDHVDTGNTDDLAVWTIACWAKSPAAPSGDPSSASGPVHREQNYQFNWNHQSDDFRASVTVNAGGWYPASLGTLEANTWYHLAGTYDGEDLKAYKDGVLITTNDAPSGPPNAETGTLKLGRHATAAQYFTGTVDEAMVYSRVLSEPEIRYLAGERATPVDPGSDGLVAYYALENDVLDGSGNELHGTIVGEPTFVEGPAGYGTAMAFDGVDDYVDFGNDPLFDITEQVSLAVWVNANDMLNGEHNPWLGKGDHCYAIKHQSGNYLEFFIYDGGWHSTVFTDYDESMNGEWYHTAGTYDGIELKFYLDGEVVATLDHEGSIETREHPVTMGTNSEAGGRFYDGALDEAVIYNRALSAGEIRYLAGFRPMVDPGTDALIAYYPLDIDTLDASGNGNDGTVNGDPTFVDGMVGTAMEFDGTGDFLDCGNNPILALTDAVSISAWIKVAVQNADHKVGGNQDGANGGYKMSVYSNKIEFEIRTAGNSAVLNRSVAGGTLLEVDVWYHVTGVYSLADGYIRTYVNGELDRELLTTEALGASPGALMIGCEPFSTGQYNFNGVMDDIRVYNKALSEDEARYLGNN